MPVVSRPPTVRDVLTMTAPVFNENDWCLVEWTDFTRTVVHSSEVVDLEGQISGSTVFIKNGDDLLRSSLVERNSKSSLFSTIFSFLQESAVNGISVVCN